MISKEKKQAIIIIGPIVLQGDYSTDSLKCASSAYT